ncbi:MAG TPA: hypothetical protein PK448_03650, partial [Bacteroidales bacterium]|nr:hypothetical protein [Bacteroidales bacterium]
RTCNRAPTPSVARGHALIENKINYLIIKHLLHCLLSNKISYLRVAELKILRKDLLITFILILRR